MVSPLSVSDVIYTGRHLKTKMPFQNDWKGIWSWQSLLRDFDAVDALATGINGDAVGVEHRVVGDASVGASVAVANEHSGGVNHFFDANAGSRGKIHDLPVFAVFDATGETPICRIRQDACPCKSCVILLRGGRTSQMQCLAILEWS
jgi:hypothetical protein